jgi:hypothetical protein
MALFLGRRSGEIDDEGTLRRIESLAIYLNDPITVFLIEL